MLALSVKQPYASMILQGLKTLEFRNWRLPLGEPIALHSARVHLQLESLDAMHQELLDPYEVVSEEELIHWIALQPRGVVLGVIRCTGHTGANVDGWCFPGRGKWTVGNQVEVVECFDRPCPAQGKLGLWEWRPEDQPPGKWLAEGEVLE